MYRSFDGVDDFVHITSVNLATVHTVQFWHHWKHNAGQDAIFIGGENTFYIYADGRGGANSLYYRTGGLNSLVAIGGDGWLDGSPHTWFNVAIARTSLQLEFYKNAISMGTAALDANNDMILGTIGGYNAGTFDWKGEMGWVSFHNVRLTTNEIAQNMRYPGSVRRGLINLWPLQGGTREVDVVTRLGTTLSGTTVLANDGPPINGAYFIPSPNLFFSASTAPPVVAPIFDSSFVFSVW